MYIEAAEQNARELVSQFGRVVEVHLKTNGEIEVVFEKGAVCTLGSLFKFGYPGTGPQCFATWLQAAGFSVTFDDVASMKAPKTLRPEGVSDGAVPGWAWITDYARKSALQAEEAKAKRQAEEAKRKQEKEKRRQEAQAKWAAEKARNSQEAKAKEQRRAKIQAERKSAAQCVMCGRALTFFQKLLGKDRHGACASFIDTPCAPTVTQEATVAPPPGAGDK
jgi:hypothetical protein